MRYLEAESTFILGNFTTGDSVTVAVYKLSDNSKVVDAAACSEISTTGRFKYSFSQAIAAKTEYLWVMTNGIEEQQGKIILGGYPEDIKNAIIIKQATVNDAAATTTKFITDLTETAPNFWDRGALVFISGNNKGLIRGIKNYNSSTKEIQIQTPLSYAPADGDAFSIIPARKFLTPDIIDFRVEMDDNSTKLASIKTEAAKIQPEIIDKKDEYKATGFAKPGDVVCGSGGGGGGFTQRADIWKREEKLKLIEDIKKIHKMIDELGSLQSAGVQNVKKNIEGLKNSLIKLIKEEVTLLISLKKIISEQPKTDTSDALADSVNQIIAKWDSIQKSILKPSDLSSLDNKLDDLTKIMAKSLSNKDLEELVNAE